MNSEIFASVLAALVLFRLLSPLVNRLASWLYGSTTHANIVHSGSSKAESIGFPKDQATMESYTTGRHRYARGPATEDLKQKLMARLQNEHDFELLAEDFIEVIAVARNDADGFCAASRELDRLSSFELDQS